MNERTYIVAFDPLNTSFNPLAVRRAIKANAAFPKWWNHIANVFLVKTALSAEQISSFLHSASAGTRFLVMQVDPTNSEGLLPERSWNWIKQRGEETLHAEDA